MDEKQFTKEYRQQFDGICASPELRRAVMDLKPQKRTRAITPFKATIGTVAAAVMIFAAVHEYSFETDTTGVISETVASTALPEAQFEIVEKTHDTATEGVNAKKPGSNGENSPVTTAVPIIGTAPAGASAPATTTAPVKDTAPAASPIPTTQEDEGDHGIEPAAHNGQTGPKVRSIGDTADLPTVQMWSLEEYYSYLGVNIASRIGGRYTGTGSIELEVSPEGTPVDDMAVLPFVTSGGAVLRVTVSKKPFFDLSLSGSVAEAGSGLNGYKSSGGVYYNVYGQNITEEEMRAIISAL